MELKDLYPKQYFSKLEPSSHPHKSEIYKQDMINHMNDKSIRHQHNRAVAEHGFKITN